MKYIMQVPIYIYMAFGFIIPTPNLLCYFIYLFCF